MSVTSAPHVGRGPPDGAPHDRHVERRDRTPDHFGKHRREDEIIVTADENDLDPRRNFLFEVLCERHTAKSTAYNNHPSFSHVRPPSVTDLRPELFQIRPVPSNNREALAGTGDWIRRGLPEIPEHRT